MLNAHRGLLRAPGVAGPIRSVLHGPDGPQAQQEVVAGDQRQIHDLSRSRGIASAGRPARSRGSRPRVIRANRLA